MSPVLRQNSIRNENRAIFSRQSVNGEPLFDRELPSPARSLPQEEVCVRVRHIFIKDGRKPARIKQLGRNDDVGRRAAPQTGRDLKLRNEP